MERKKKKKRSQAKLKGLDRKSIPGIITGDKSKRARNLFGESSSRPGTLSRKINRDARLEKKLET